jgi:hypothetical protein
MTGLEKPKIEIPFNERTLEAFSKEGLTYSHENAIRKRHNKFRLKFKPDKGPLQVVISQMIIVLYSYATTMILIVISSSFMKRS